MISANTKYKLEQFFFIQVYWILAVVFFITIRYLFAPEEAYPVAPNGFIWLYTIVGSIVIGCLVGSLVVFIYPKLVYTKSFAKSLILKLIGFILSIHTVIILIIICIAIVQKSDIQELIHQHVFTPQTAIFYIYGISVNLTLDAFLQLNQRLGPGRIRHILTGKYFQPRVEKRLFMFLDLKDSTAIAEKLGHIAFSSLIRDCFNDLSDLYLKYNAQPYQYVGDEAVVTWKYEEGIDDDQYLRFFLDFQDLLERKKYRYLEKYGLAPTFPAAVNAGEVTVTEVGHIKSELAYHGDVLNAAARIQKLCKVYEAPILITSCLAEQVNNFSLQKLDTVTVSGKTQSIGIYSLEKEKAD